MIDLAMIGFASGQNQVATIMLDNAAQALYLSDHPISYHASDKGECGFHHVGTDSVFFASGGMFGNALGKTTNYNAEVGQLYSAIGNKMGLNLNGYGRAKGSLKWE